MLGSIVGVGVLGASEVEKVSTIVPVADTPLAPAEGDTETTPIGAGAVVEVVGVVLVGAAVVVVGPAVVGVAAVAAEVVVGVDPPMAPRAPVVVGPAPILEVAPVEC